VNCAADEGVWANTPGVTRAVIFGGALGTVSSGAMMTAGAFGSSVGVCEAGTLCGRIEA
jgi:hypothetical protein